MIKVKSLSLVIISGLALTACGSSQKIAPDEFQVVDTPTLVVPPNAELAPPRPGQVNPQAMDPGRQAYEALFPGAKVETPKKPEGGEAALITQVQRHMQKRSGPDVRSNAGQPDLAVVKKTLLLSELMDGKEYEFKSEGVTLKRTSGSR